MIYLLKNLNGECDQQKQSVSINQSQDNALSLKVSKESASNTASILNLYPKQINIINAENQQDIAFRRIQAENEHLKRLNNEKEEKIEQLEFHAKQQEERKNQYIIDKLVSISTSILSSYGTKEDLNSIHFTNTNEAGPKMVLFDRIQIIYINYNRIKFNDI